MNKKSFSKKKLIADFLKFDWKNYIKSYDDLTIITTKEDAWYHWINYGKHENRVIIRANDDKAFEEFDWKSYVSSNKDLSYIVSKENAWKHWITHGKNENRFITNVSKKKEFEKFDWKSYISNNEDLSYIVTKEKAWKHWITHGKNENRVVSAETTLEEYDNFDWKSYVSNYDDLSLIKSKENAWKHWMSHGKNENRIYENIFLFDDYKTFDWKKYIHNYDDLTYIDSKEEAWKHFILYGFNEGRKLNDIKEIEMKEFQKIVNVEESFDDIDFSDNKIYFKKQYTNCGNHFFGWKSTMNYLLEHYNFDTFDSFDFKKKYYFDEWIEKLLVWGNKIQSQKCLRVVKDENLQLITFLHGPPFEEYNRNLMSKDFILNDDSLLNKNSIELIHSNNLLCSITFLYVLSIHHKNYIINNYPEFKNKVLSVYHPIDIDINNYTHDDLFSVGKFMSKKNIYHIGWWLRNFTSFSDFKVPKDYNKFILLKQEFKSEFYEKFSSIDKNIQIVDEVSDNDYKEIFGNSCIFCDLADAVANNVVLECVKYNTPIIVRRIPSIEEYLGVNYPLFFDDVSDLSKFSNQKTLHKSIVAANEYLLKMDKRPFTLDTFLNKTTYDINKLKVNHDTYKLTWLYYLHNEEDDIDSYISIFNNQLSVENIKLIIINSLSSKKELLEKYNTGNISIIHVDSELPIEKIYDIFITNSTTEYLILKNLNNYTEENYSDVCIHYLENNPTFDVIIFKNNENINIHYDETNVFEIHYDNSSESSNPSDILSETSDQVGNNKIFTIDNNTIESGSELELELEESGSELELELEESGSELELELEESGSELELELEETGSELELELEETGSEQYDTIQNNENLLTYSQIYDYNFDDKNIHILWRKSIHSFIHRFDENFWLNVHKNHLNIFEIK
jgi:hypothetical protein